VRPDARIAIVVPTTGRPSLARLLRALARQRAGESAVVVVVDDRGTGAGTLPGQADAAAGLGSRLMILPGRSRGPAAARNLGWRATDAPWIAFLDDDVVPEDGWVDALRRDVAALGPGGGGSQGRIRVPLPSGRRPIDWEREVAGLEHAAWATADMAYRRAALAAVGGFDERFPRAYREDADLALRVMDAGWTLERGRRGVLHPPGPAGPWISVRRQAGNADDVLMRALHGPAWRERARVAPGRRPRHVAITAAGIAALVLAAAARRRGALVAAAAWTGGTAEFAYARIAAGPRTGREVATMLATSTAIPPVAVFHALRARLRLGALLADRTRAPRPGGGPPPAAVLLDRDGTLVADVPYNGDPGRVRILPGVVPAVDRLRRAGIPTAVVSNQSGVARGLIDLAQVASVNARIEELIGPLGPWLICPHAPDDDCGCRKPAPGMVVEAARRLGVAPSQCAVIGDIGAGVEAARRAGARAVLVPTARTRREEVAAAPEVAADLAGAVEMLIGGTR
jgi:histidinol-phosphate phosphatase family protein